LFALLLDQHAVDMTDHDDFVAWVNGLLYEAEVALHNGDPRPRLALWSRNEPVSVLGAWRNARGRREVEELFGFLRWPAAHLHLACNPGVSP
jgi:hypothetical protein